MDAGGRMDTKYVGPNGAKLVDAEGHGITSLLWGDTVHVLDPGLSPQGRVHARARARQGWVDAASLDGESLLEIYVIDVGQGDGVLVKTPGGAWLLIDGGKPSRLQKTKKGAANFLRWKFIRDLGLNEVSLQSVILTHADLDHYGGLIDVLSGQLADGTPFAVTVENLYHSGLARFRDDPELGTTGEGTVPDFPVGGQGVRRKGSFITQLLGDKDSFANPPRALQGDFAPYAALVATVPDNVERVSSANGHLPGYGPGERELEIRVLGPVQEDFGNGTGLRTLTSDSITLNGHSVVLRLDYKQARILLTGDLNSRSQRLLLAYHSEDEFAVDVVKACHHGSEDVDFDFIRAVQARATVISSGDDEDYAHPRPVLMGASGRYGREAMDRSDHPMPPLIYSTELARAVKLAFAHRVKVEPTDQTLNPEEIQVMPRQTDARFIDLERMPLSTDLVYGLVNVRTDGETVLCATLEEEGNDFDVKRFKAGVDV
jgi:beta-lactamase superfamily II metal-dependent hydrolase